MNVNLCIHFIPAGVQISMACSIAYFEAMSSGTPVVWTVYISKIEDGHKAAILSCKLASSWKESSRWVWVKMKMDDCHESRIYFYVQVYIYVEV